MVKANDVLWYFYYTACSGWEYMILSIRDIRPVNIYGCISVDVDSIVGKSKSRLNLPIGNYNKLVSSGLEYYTINEEVATNFIKTHIADGE